HFETAGQSADAAKWYSTAAERFRRSEWKTKAQEAAARLGGESPSNITAPDVTSSAAPVPAPEPALPFEQTAAAFTAIASESIPATEPAASGGAPGRSKRRRGRRGGRNRRKVSPHTASPPREGAASEPTRRTSSGVSRHPESASVDHVASLKPSAPES